MSNKPWGLSRRKPDFVIGEPENPYLLRWWIIPRNKWFNIYLHKIMRPDDDRALHDHPWWNLSLILKGGYVELTPCRCSPYCTGLAKRERKPGALVFRRAEAAHRLDLPVAYQVMTWGPKDIQGKQRTGYRPCWSLFITGPRVRRWGFHCPQGWVDWEVFVDKTDHGSVGRGCGES